MVGKRTSVRYNQVVEQEFFLETTYMSELKDVITSYNSLSFSDRIVFYTTISNDIPHKDDIQSFLIETRLDGDSCIFLQSEACR